MPDIIVRFFQFNYWFNKYTEPIADQAFYVALAVILFGLVVAMFTKFKIDRASDGVSRRVWRRVMRLSITMSIVLAVFLFFTQTATPILGARWWYLLWLIAGVVWLGIIMYDFVVVVPKEKKSRTSYETYAKYLPRSR